jgi:hypothetical protein
MECSETERLEDALDAATVQFSSLPSPLKSPSYESPTSMQSSSSGSPSETLSPPDKSQMTFNKVTPLFGSRSIPSFIMQLRTIFKAVHAFGRDLMPDPHIIDHSFGGRPVTMARPEVLQPQDLTKLVLPSRDVADELLGCFWNSAYPLFPVLHRPTFMATYEKLWTGSGVIGGGHGSSQQILFNVTLNLVFAIACQFTTAVRPEKRSAYGAEFYERSRMINNVELLDGVELSVVQVLLLQAIYLYWDQQRHTDRCWNVLGAAIRAAQGLGLM